MTFLLTNDDGYFAPGLPGTVHSLKACAQAIVLVPDQGRSASSMAVTLHKPLRVSEADLDGDRIRVCNGTPVDCVLLGRALHEPSVLQGVVSGVNDGPNLGLDIHYSGTVAAARKAALLGLPGVALSMGELGLPGIEIHFATAWRMMCSISALLADQPPPPGVYLNINVPNRPAGEIAGIEWTRPGTRRYRDLMEARVDPAGREYYWTNGVSISPDDTPGTDAAAVAGGRVSLTPLSVDLAQPIPDWDASLWASALGEVFAEGVAH